MKRIGCVILLAATVAPALSEAATVSFDLGTTFSGGAPYGSAPWVNVTIADTATAGTVQVTITGVNLRNQSAINLENVSSVYLNVAPALDSQLGTGGFTITYLSGISATSATSAADAYKADGDGY